MTTKGVTFHALTHVEHLKIACGQHGFRAHVPNSSVSCGMRLSAAAGWVAVASRVSVGTTPGAVGGFASHQMHAGKLGCAHLWREELEHHPCLPFMWVLAWLVPKRGLANEPHEQLLLLCIEQVPEHVRV
ncbi:hypothetical protein DENSPDRAFT_284379 [Dentipellis sp. KUC8613]|nr:hypothetical protein DENSPDRAFT_284379 [Dentipellis sp. KUC8613]